MNGFRVLFPMSFIPGRRMLCFSFIVSRATVFRLFFILFPLLRRVYFFFFFYCLWFLFCFVWSCVFCFQFLKESIHSFSICLLGSIIIGGIRKESKGKRVGEKGQRAREKRAKWRSVQETSSLVGFPICSFYVSGVVGLFFGCISFQPLYLGSLFFFLCAVFSLICFLFMYFIGPLVGV